MTGQHGSTEPTGCDGALIRIGPMNLYCRHEAHHVARSSGRPRPTAAHVWIPKAGEGLHGGRNRSRHAAEGRHLEMGSRHSRALCRSRQDGAEHREDAADLQREQDRRAASREDAQVRGDCEDADGGRRDRHLHRQAERSGSALRRGHRSHPDDDREPAARQDSPRDGVEEALPGIHPGR